MKIRACIDTLFNYPANEEHLECIIMDMDCFKIKKGEDGYYYNDKSGKEQSYNYLKSDIVDKRWIVHLDNEYASDSLIEIFDIKVSRNLDTIIKYCVKLYIKSLEMESERIQKEKKIYTEYKKEDEIEYDILY